MNLSYINAVQMCKGVIGIFITGSHAYGMNLPTSDKDMKAIAILPPELMFKTGEPIETLVMHPDDFERHPELMALLGIDVPTDFEIHTLGKFIELAKKGNPTILEMLFTEERFITKRTPQLDLLLQNKDKFLSRAAINAFGGYARQQLIRIKHGVGMGLDSSDESLTRDLYDSMSRIVDSFNVNHDGIAAMTQYDKTADEDQRISISFERAMYLPELIALLTEVKQCRETYMALNAKNRKKDEGKMLKHAAHLIRLLKSGLELAQTGRLNVYRRDATYLLEIRKGKHPIEEVIEQATELFEQLDQSYPTTVLPALAETESINAIYSSIMSNYYGINKPKE